MLLTCIFNSPSTASVPLLAATAAAAVVALALLIAAAADAVSASVAVAGMSALSIVKDIN